MQEPQNPITPIQALKELKILYHQYIYQTQPRAWNPSDIFVQRMNRGQYRNKFPIDLCQKFTETLAEVLQNIGGLIVPLVWNSASIAELQQELRDILAEKQKIKWLDSMVMGGGTMHGLATISILITLIWTLAKNIDFSLDPVCIALIVSACVSACSLLITCCGIQGLHNNIERHPTPDLESAEAAYISEQLLNIISRAEAAGMWYPQEEAALQVAQNEEIDEDPIPQAGLQLARILV